MRFIEPKLPTNVLLSLLLLGLVGCGSGVAGGKQAYSDEFEGFVKQIEAIYEEHDQSIVGLRTISVEKADLSPDEKGKCEENFLKGSKIYVNNEYWSQSSDEEKLILLLHEFGHCFLNRNHDFTIVRQGSNNIPESLMYPSGISEGQFDQFRDAYLTEYFGR